jgi:hypothetical protein
MQKSLIIYEISGLLFGDLHQYTLRRQVVIGFLTNHFVEKHQ